MIFGYSDFCPPCHRIQPLWSQLADELTPMGVSFASVNLERDGSLRDELRILHVPSIIVVIDGKVHMPMFSFFVWHCFPVITEEKNTV